MSAFGTGTEYFDKETEWARESGRRSRNGMNVVRASMMREVKTVADPTS